MFPVLVVLNIQCYNEYLCRSEKGFTSALCVLVQYRLPSHIKKVVCVYVSLCVYACDCISVRVWTMCASVYVRVCGCACLHVCVHVRVSCWTGDKKSTKNKPKKKNTNNNVVMCWQRHRLLTLILTLDLITFMH